MSAQPTHTTPPDNPTQPAADPHGFRAVLHTLVGMGADMARLLHAQATHQAEAARAAVPPPPTPAMPYEPPATTLVALAGAFDCISRTVRRCIALAEHLARPPAPNRDPARSRTAARKRILREVEDTIHRTAHEGDRAESLQAELRDRLDAPDLDWDLATRPIPDIIAELTQDLGLAPAPGGAHPWKRRTPSDIQDLCTRAAAPSHAATDPSGRPAANGHWPASPAWQDGPHVPGNAAGQSLDEPHESRDQGNTRSTPGGPQPGTAETADDDARHRAPAAPRSTSPQPANPASIPMAARRANCADGGQHAPTQRAATVLLHPTRLRGHWRPPPGT